MIQILIIIKQKVMFSTAYRKYIGRGYVFYCRLTGLALAASN